MKVSFPNMENIGMDMNAVKAVQYFIKKAKFIHDIQTAEGIVRAYERDLTLSDFSHAYSVFIYFLFKSDFSQFPWKFQINVVENKST